MHKHKQQSEYPAFLGAVLEEIALRESAGGLQHSDWALGNGQRWRSLEEYDWKERLPDLNLSGALLVDFCALLCIGHNNVSSSPASGRISHASQWRFGT